jgi:RNA polymerase sigma-70 factor (family 1)
VGFRRFEPLIQKQTDFFMELYRDDSDAAILGALKKGDRKAFEVIYYKYVPELFAYARRNISSKEDCEEIIQDVFASIWARRETMKVDTLRYYLLSMVKYKIVRYFQHSAVKRKYLDHYRAFEAVYVDLEDHSVDPDALQKLIDERLVELPERCQVAFRLRLHQNLSNTDIAHRMNITKKTVEVYMFQAFKHLRASCRTHLKHSEL